MTDPTRVSPIDLVLIRAMLEGEHINYPGLLKLRDALTDEENVLGWHPSLFETREAVLALVVAQIERVEHDTTAGEWGDDDWPKA